MQDQRHTVGDDVFPTGVGMNRPAALFFLRSSSVPHRRGDEPRFMVPVEKLRRCSPQAWG